MLLVMRSRSVHEPQAKPGVAVCTWAEQVCCFKTLIFPGESLLTACMASHRPTAKTEPNIHVDLSNASCMLVLVFVSFTTFIDALWLAGYTH